ncbi:MAG: tetratricopeptide repeat protein [Elusimicrobiota bacterium]
MKKTDFAILAILSILVFADTVRVPFIWDDEAQVKQNVSIRTPTISTFFKPAYWQAYRTTLSPVELPLKPLSPIRIISYMIDYKLWGLNAEGFHITNIILHIVNVILVYLFCWLVFRNRNVAFFTGLLFACHPMHVETVAWIKNRIDLICSVFYLSSLILFIKHAEQTRNLKHGTDAKQNTELTQNRPFLISKSLISNLYPLFSILCFILALLSKEMAVTLPMILILYYICFQPKNNLWTKSQQSKILLNAIKKTIPYWLITVGYFCFQFFYVRAGEVTGLVSKLGLVSHIGLVGKTITVYLKLLLLPFRFTVEHFLSEPKSVSEPGVLIALSTILLYILVCYFLWTKRQHGLLFSLVFIPVTLLPVSNIMYLVTRPVAEHRLYIPSIGFCLILGKLFADGILTGFIRLTTVGQAGKISTTKTRNSEKSLKLRDFIISWLKELKILLILSKIVFLLLIFAYSYASMKRNLDWLSPVQLWESTLKLSAGNFRAHYNLGVSYLQALREQEALAQFELASKILPEDPFLQDAIGVFYMVYGSTDTAIEKFKSALKIYPDFDNSQANLGWAYYLKGEKEKALQYIKKAIEINPEFPLPHRHLAQIYWADGKIEAALIEYRIACELMLYGWEMHKEFIELLEKTKRFDEAITEYKRAIELNPYLIDAYNNLGIVYVQKGMYKEAEASFKKVLEINPADSAGVRNLSTVERIMDKLEKNKK